MPLINFKLRHPDNVTPWGTPPHTRMHWFGLTDREYWLELGEVKVYEYSDAILKYWEVTEFKYVDYQLIRLVEDLASIISSIAEPVPDEFYEIARSHESLYQFYKRANEWLEKLADNPTISQDDYYDRYDKIIEWIYSRSDTAMHLTYGPDVSFFRNRENITIVYSAAHTDHNIPVWTAGTGTFEMPYATFVEQLEEFGQRFFAAMQQQVGIAVQKDWGTAEIDKGRLVEEQVERQVKFNETLEILKKGSDKQTDWPLVRQLIEEMEKE